MPIRINLLAEQIAADEARRRDPVKRGIWVAGALVALMVLWGVTLILEVKGMERELARYEERFQKLDIQSTQGKKDRQLDTEIGQKLTALEAYSRSRFLWGTALDALQRVAVDKVRLLDVSADQKYALNPLVKVATNVTVQLPPKSKWSFFGAKGPPFNLMLEVTNQIVPLKNRYPFNTNKVGVTVKIGEMKTNAQQEVTVKLEVITPVTSSERTILTIRGRDYNTQAPGAQVGEFMKAIGALPYFKTRLYEAAGQGISLPYRSINPVEDLFDLSNRGPYIEFTVQCSYEERVFANE